MAHIHVSLHDADSTPEVDVLRIDSSGQRFMTLHITKECSIYLPGHDHVAVVHALALATAIRDAAEELQTALQERQVLEVVN